MRSVWSIFPARMTSTRNLHHQCSSRIWDPTCRDGKPSSPLHRDKWKQSGISRFLAIEMPHCTKDKNNYQEKVGHVRLFPAAQSIGECIFLQDDHNIRCFSRLNHHTRLLVSIMMTCYIRPVAWVTMLLVLPLLADSLPTLFHRNARSNDLQQAGHDRTKIFERPQTPTRLRRRQRR